MKTRSSCPLNPLKGIIVKSVDQLFMHLFNKIDTELSSEDFAQFGFEHCKIDDVKMGEIVKLETFAQRRIIVVGTPVGPLVIGEVWPRDATRLRILEAPRLIRVLMKSADAFLTEADWVKLFGDEETNSSTYWTTDFIKRFNQPQQEFLFQEA